MPQFFFVLAIFKHPVFILYKLYYILWMIVLEGIRNNGLVIAKIQINTLDSNPF
jgi:hypothetical protein